MAINVDTNNPVYTSVAGVLFNQSQTTLIQYPSGMAGNYTVPNSVVSIGGAAFFGCSGLKNVTIPNSVTSIGGDAFSSCTSLTNVTIPNSVNAIAGLFQSCTQLISVTIPNSVTNIGDDTFWGCTSLTSVTIPNGVTSIGIEAFYICSKLTSVTIPNSVTNIGVDAFSGCSNLTSITIPKNVTNIGDYMFAACTSLKSIYFQGNAPSVSYNAFSGYDGNGYDPATVYYLPGTTGWSTTLGGLPTKLWNPQVQTKSATFGVQTNRFGFTITGISGLVIVVEACTNFSNPVWTAVATKTLTGGSSYFSDSNWTNYPARFYRLRSP
jgi:hypothetical protein